jgi:hypothetical protein
MLVYVKHVLNLPCLVFFVALHDAHTVYPEQLAAECRDTFAGSDENIYRYWVRTNGSLDAHSSRIDILNIWYVVSSPHV